MKLFNIIIRSFPFAGLLLLASRQGKTVGRRKEHNLSGAKRQHRDLSGSTTSELIAGTSDQIFVTSVIDDIDWLIVWLNAGLMKRIDTRHKMYAEAMLADHEALLGRLAAYAYGEGYTIPKVDIHRATHIIRSAGKKWNDDWATVMANKQQELIGKLEERSVDTKADELKQLIGQTVPILRNHYEITRQLMSTPVH